MGNFLALNERSSTGGSQEPIQLTQKTEFEVESRKKLLPKEKVKNSWQKYISIRYYVKQFTRQVFFTFDFKKIFIILQIHPFQTRVFDRKLRAYLSLRYGNHQRLKIKKIAALSA